MAEVAITETILSDLTEVEDSGTSATTNNDSRESIQALKQQTTNEIISGQPSSLEQEDRNINKDNFTNGRIPRVALKDFSDDGYCSMYEQSEKRLDADSPFWKHPKCVNPIPRCFPKLKSNNQTPEGYEAERLVFNLFNKLTRFGCFLIHGLVLKKNNKRTAEVDFIVVAPNHQIILVEVKALKKKDQLRKILKGAIKQIKNKIKPGIETEIEKRYGKTIKIPTIDCVMFPNMQVSTDDVNRILIQENLSHDFIVASENICVDLHNFQEWFFEQCVTKMENCEELYEATIVSLIGKRLSEEVSATTGINQITTDIQKIVTRTIELTMEQDDCLECMDPTMVIYGPAGAGKTQLLLMKIKRILENDDLRGKTIVICSNSWLCKYLEFQVNLKYVDVYEISNFFKKFIKHKIPTCDCQLLERPQYPYVLNDMDPDCLMIPERYRHVFVDEAEGICFGTFQPLNLIQHQPKNKEIHFRWFFVDPSQNLNHIFTTINQIEKKHYLTKIVRTTSNIQDIVSKNVLFRDWPTYKRVKLDHGIAGPSIKWIELLNIRGEHIAEEIYSKCLVPLLIESEIKIRSNTNENVVILVENDLHQSRYVHFRHMLIDLCAKNINVKFRYFDYDDHPNPDHKLPSVMVGGIGVFKGFEAPVVIVILDNYCSTESSYLYTAASRCYCQLYVVTTSAIMEKVNGPRFSTNHRHLFQKMFSDLTDHFDMHPFVDLVREAFILAVRSYEKQLKEICICTDRSEIAKYSKGEHNCEEDYEKFLEDRLYPFIYLLEVHQPEEDISEAVQNHFLELLQGEHFPEHDQKEKENIEKIRNWRRDLKRNVTLEQVECVESKLKSLVVASSQQFELDTVLLMKVLQLKKADHLNGEIIVFYDNSSIRNANPIIDDLDIWPNVKEYFDKNNFPNISLKTIKVGCDETLGCCDEKQEEIVKFRLIFMLNPKTIGKHFYQLFVKVQTGYETDLYLWILENDEKYRPKYPTRFYKYFPIKELKGYQRSEDAQP